jgi:hypothetical protein
VKPISVEKNRVSGQDDYEEEEEGA